MAKKFSELRAKMSPERQAAVKAKTDRMIAEYALDELREALQLTQQQLAAILKKDQSVISRIEKRTDMYISTLAGFIEAMGGSLELRATFPEGSVRIKRFGDYSKPPAADV